MSFILHDVPEFTHCSLSAVTHAPFHASMLRPASDAGPMHEVARVGKLVNAALLSLYSFIVRCYLFILLWNRTQGT